MASEEVEDQGPGPSLYNFDLMTPDGVDRVLALLPILDEAIVKAVYQECFPGYPIDNISPRIARVELRGFFMDFLDGSTPANEAGSDDSTEEPGTEDPDEGEEEGGASPGDLSAGEEGTGDPDGSESPEGTGEDDEGQAPSDGNVA